jgi:plasmid maintenance system antidote protein VapI
MTERERAFTPDEITTIRERFHGWEQASATQLAAIFGTTVQRISAIVHSNRPDAIERGEHIGKE